MQKSLKPILIILFFCIGSIDYARASDSYFRDAESYNNEQMKRAKRFYISEQPQQKDACVCNSAANIAGALKKDKSETTRRLTSCSEIKKNFSGWYVDFRDEFPGTLFGGMMSKFDRMKFVSSDRAMKAITEAIDNGQVAAVSLDAVPMYENYIERYTVAEKDAPEDLDAPFGINHAVVVIGMLRSETGQISDFIIADSSGPARKYVISAASFRKGYDGFHARLSRGVFIPDQRIHSPMRASWTQ